MTNDEIRKKFEDRYEKSLFPLYKFNRTLRGVYADNAVQFLWEGFYSGFTVANAEIESLKSELKEKDVVLFEVLSYLEWREDDLIGDDIKGDGKLTKRFKQVINTINNTLQKYRGNK